MIPAGLTLEYLRQFRFLEFAIFDFTVSLIAVLILSPLLNRLAKKAKINITTKHWLWLFLPISVIAHLLFGQQTALVKQVFDLTGNYSAKLLMIFMLFMGLKDVRKINK
jgi:hypothetical protein